MPEPRDHFFPGEFHAELSLVPVPVYEGLFQRGIDHAVIYQAKFLGRQPSCQEFLLRHFRALLIVHGGPSPPHSSCATVRVLPPAVGENVPSRKWKSWNETRSKTR